MSAASLLFAAAVAVGESDAAWLAVDRASGAERCPGATDIAAAVAERLGRRPFAPGDGVRARVSMGGRGRSLQARVELLDGAGRALGTRELSAGADSGCEKLAGAVILSLAFALDADRRDEGPPPAAPAGSLPLPVVAPAAVAAVPVERARPPVPPDRHHAWFVGVGTTVGSLPGLAMGAHVGAAIGRGRIAVEGWLGADRAFPARWHGVEVRAWRAAAGVAPCLVGRTRFTLCAPVRGALMRAEATAGLTRANVVTLPLVEVGARGRVALGLGGPWALGIVADVGVPLLRARLLVDGDGLWRTPPITAWLGVEARWRSR